MGAKRDHHSVDRHGHLVDRPSASSTDPTTTTDDSNAATTDTDDPETGAAFDPNTFLSGASFDDGAHGVVTTAKA
ncbi:hypothetical protein JCM10207_000587 [Rhodosporidiobolus poonsookiae]